MECTECSHRVSFSNKSNLRAHLKKFHPDKLNVIAPKKTFKCVAICNKCSKRFAKYSNLKRHVTEFHPANVDELTSPKIYPYQCRECHKNFSHRYNLRRHQKSHVTDNEKKKQLFKCSLCVYTNALKSDIIVHLEEYHDIEIKRHELHFSSELQFKNWKADLEKKNYSFYAIYGTPFTTREGNRKTTYICHRTGFYIKKGCGVRHLKTQGSRKINGLCPSEMKVILLENGTVNVNFIETHTGHDNDLGHVNISKNEKMEIASKIASKIPLASILDDIRDSITNNELERIHLLTRKDLNNISQCFNLNSEGIRHKNEVISIESWVQDYGNSGIVLFYKAQGILSEDFSGLKKEDFVLIILHPGQLEILEQFGDDVICIDGTHGLNAHDFELTTLLVLDDMREGFPCCFMIANRSDEEIMAIFFMKIKDKLGRAVKPHVFMSDMANCYYNAWVQIMCPATFRLFCSWHVDRAWRNNLDKIDGKEQKVLVYKQLRTLLQETDAVAFTEMLENFCVALLSSPETHEFGNYFEKYYLSNIKSWAYCYRLHAGINTNMSIERMHHLIKYLYFNGKQVKRLDKTINTLLKLIRDKIFDRLITLEKGKLSSKIRELRKRHKTSHDLDMVTVVSCEMGWEVPSSSQNGVYLVQNHKANCDCKLVCTLCEACLHSYTCSCVDNSIRMNMCKHIHLVCQFLKGNKIFDTGHNSEDEEYSLIIDETSSYRAIEKEKLVNVVSKSNPNPNRTTQDLETRKQKLIASLTQEIQNISSFDQLEAVEKITAPVHPTLKAMDAQSGDTEIHAMDLLGLGLTNKKTIPHNKNILPQRRLFSTRNKSKKSKKKLLAKPKPEEAILIANQLLIDS